MTTTLLPRAAQRLVLRRFDDNDIAAFQAYRNDPEVARYQSWEGCTLDQARSFVRVQKAQPEAAPGEWLQIAIALQATNALIGDCALKIHAHDRRQAVIGFTLARAYQGQGFAFEAVACLLDYLFGELHLHRVCADADPRNTASCRLLERLGMRREGHLVQSLWFKGDWVDEVLFAILSNEWFERRGEMP